MSDGSGLNWFGDISTGVVSVVGVVTAYAALTSARTARFVADNAGKLAIDAETRKAEGHLKGLAGALLGELEAYVELLNIPVTRQNYLEMAIATDMRQRLAIIPRLPETHPVFDRCADQIGVLPGDLPREVSKLYNYVTGIRLLITGLSNPSVEKVPDHIVSQRIQSIVDGFDRGLALYKEVAPALRRLSGSPSSDYTIGNTSMSGASKQSSHSETTAFILQTFSDLYQQEVAAEEDVYRTLPFFGTALGVGVAALAYAAGRLPQWTAIRTHVGHIAFSIAAVLLILFTMEAALVLIQISRAIARHPYQRIGPESALRARVTELQAYYDATASSESSHDDEILKDMRDVLLDSYTQVTTANRALNARRYRLRALAASHLIRSLIWALGATTVIAVSDKLGYLTKVIP